MRIKDRTPLMLNLAGRIGDTAEFLTSDVEQTLDVGRNMARIYLQRMRAAGIVQFICRENGANGQKIYRFLPDGLARLRARVAAERCKLPVPVETEPLPQAEQKTYTERVTESGSRVIMFDQRRPTSRDCIGSRSNGIPGTACSSIASII